MEKRGVHTLEAVLCLMYGIRNGIGKFHIRLNRLLRWAIVLFLNIGRFQYVVFYWAICIDMASVCEFLLSIG